MKWNDFFCCVFGPEAKFWLLNDYCETNILNLMINNLFFSKLFEWNQITMERSLIMIFLKWQSRANKWWWCEQRFLFIQYIQHVMWIGCVFSHSTFPGANIIFFKEILSLLYKLILVKVSHHHCKSGGYIWTIFHAIVVSVDMSQICGKPIDAYALLAAN